MAPTIRHLTQRSIPVMAHIGLTPQSVHTFGGYKVQGRGAQASAVLRDAQAVAEAGAFAVVVEKVPDLLARRVTSDIDIPTIGIGASAACDGQILVVDDMLGMFSDFKPKFVKRFADLGENADAAISRYAQEVRSRSFPAPEHLFGDAPASVPGAG